MSKELTDVRCSCGDEYPADSYDAGFIAGSGMCQNCDAALPPKDICTCPSGDGSLRHPCPAHPAVEQAGGDERVIGWRERILAAHPNSNPGFWTDALLVEHMAAEIADLRAALAQPSPASDLDPLNLAAHAEAFNEAHDEALRPEQAEAERPEVVAVMESNGAGGKRLAQRFPIVNVFVGDELMTVAQHGRIVEARWNRAMDLMGEHVARISEKFKAERDDALARVAELTATRNRYGVDAHYFNKNLQRILRNFESFTPDELARSLIILAKVADEKVVAQHSVPETINEEANSFLRIADAGQFKDNAVAVRTAAVIIRGLLHRPPLMQSIIRHRIGLTPEYEGQWHADLYGEDGEVQHHAEADTPDEAVRAVVALAAAPGKEGV
ncbi:TPA: hypothetical protein ACVGMT_003611 [Pseudomonas aeruginosa]